MSRTSSAILIAGAANSLLKLRTRRGPSGWECAEECVMGQGREATLCVKCSQDSPDPIGAACLQRDRRLCVSQGRGCLFGFPPYLIALAVECTEKARVWRVTPSIVPLGAIYLYLSTIEPDRSKLPVVTLIPIWNYIDRKVESGAYCGHAPFPHSRTACPGRRE